MVNPGCLSGAGIQRRAAYARARARSFIQPGNGERGLGENAVMISDARGPRG